MYSAAGDSNFDTVVSNGIPIMGGGGIPAMFGNVYFVDYRNGLEGNSGKKEEPLKTLGAAYAKCTSNNNDIICIDGDSTVQEDEAIAWSKNRIHVIGLGGGFLTGQRAKVQLSTTGNAADTSCTLNVTGVGNSFHNLKVMNSGTHASSIACLIDAGEANWYNNCSFMKFTDLDQTTVSDVEMRSDSTTYTNCELGFDTLVQSVARPTLRIKASGATRCKHLYMKDCTFVCSSSSADKAHILIENNSSLAFNNLIINPIFACALVSSTSAAALDDAINSAAGLVEGNILVVNPASNCTAVCATVTDQIQVVGPLTHVNAGAPQTPA